MFCVKIGNAAWWLSDHKRAGKISALNLPTGKKRILISYDTASTTERFKRFVTPNTLNIYAFNDQTSMPLPDLNHPTFLNAKKLTRVSLPFGQDLQKFPDSRVPAVR